MSSVHLLPFMCTLLSGKNNMQKCTDSFSQLNYASFTNVSITQSKRNIEIAAHYYYRHMSLDTCGGFCPMAPFY